MSGETTPFERGRELRLEGNLEEAGEWYASAAFNAVSQMPLYPSSGAELKHFLEATTCYRISGQIERCRNRCRMGVLVSEDLAERALSRPAPSHDVHQADRGGWYEAIGMLRLVGGLDGVAAAYDRAEEIYDAAGDPASHRTESPKTSLYAWFMSVEQAATGEVRGMEFRRQRSYTEYADYVRNKIPEYLDELVARGKWPEADVDA